MVPWWKDVVAFPFVAFSSIVELLIGHPLCYSMDDIMFGLFLYSWEQLLLL